MGASISPRYDVVVIGAGHNGLVAAVYLARAGMSTLVLERNERVGGAVASGEITRPGFVHDLFATNQNLFLGSPAFAELGDDLARHGLRFATTDRPYSNVFPDGRSLRVHQDADRTRALLELHDAGDAAGWDRLLALYDRFAPVLFELYGTRMPSREVLRQLARARRSLGAEGLDELAQLVASSTRALGDDFFATPEAKALVASWGMHLDFGPDVAMGALFPFLELFTDMRNGMSVVEGGAGRLPEALAGIVREAGGEVRTSSPVRRVTVDDGRATAIDLVSGERVEASRAVVANLTPGVLFAGMVPPESLPDGFRRRVARYAYGPGTMMIHAALSDPLAWAAGEDLHEFGYVHVAPYVDDMARTYAEALAGLLPSSPTLVVGQTTAVDPSRAPAGGHVLWVQVRMVPSRIDGDAAGSIEARRWEDAKQPVAERVLDKLERYAPGTRDRLLDWTVLGPDDLERHNPNLVGGDSVGGSHHLSQNLLFRPVPGWSSYRTPVDRLWMVGAGTWPGAGVNAISGRLAAQMITRQSRRRVARAGAVAAVGLGGAAALAAWRARR
ncbi:MAG TPA: NAD(P)/FAD-dependent oxidoreductase [Thermoleophilaceae bacterium]